MYTRHVQNKCENESGVKRKLKVTCAASIYIVLWYLANTEPFRSIADRFGLAMSTVYCIVDETIQWLCSISCDFIRWPKSDAEKAEIAANFAKCGRFPHVIGLIDSSHIKIRAPILHKIDYYNRKKFFSILLQGVVDHKKRFIDVYVGEPGSLHDNNVFERSTVGKKIATECGSHWYILGDSAYACTNSVIRPYKDYGNLTRAHNQFNYEIGKYRIRVEHAFGLLKGRWRRLLFFENMKVNFIIHCVVATTVLHNIQINCEGTDIDSDLIINDTNVAQEYNDGPNTENGLRRDLLFNELFMQQ